MKALRPRTIVTLGPTLFVLAFMASDWLGAFPSKRFGVVDALLLGLAAGLVIFGPIALAQVTRQRYPVWWLRRWLHINWYTSLAMCISLGYVIACLRHDTLDGFGLSGLAVVFVGAIIKTALGSARPADQV